MRYLILGGAQLAVGAAAIFARLALSGATPLAVAASRLVIAALVLVSIAFVRSHRRAVTRNETIVLGFAGVALAVHFATWIASLEYTSVAISTLLVSTTPMWTALYDTVFRRSPLSRIAFAAFVAGALALIAIVRYDTTPAPHAGNALLGAILAVSGAVAFAIYLLLVRNVRDDLDTRTIVTHTYAWAAVLLALTCAIVHQGPPAPTAATAWAGIIAMAFISQLLGHTAINASLKWFTPSTVAFANLLEPLCAALLALAFFGEQVPPVALVAGVLLLGCIGIVLWTDPKRQLA